MEMYMVKTLALTTVILVVIYIFIFRRRKQNKEKTFDSVAEYHDRYLSRTKKDPDRTNFITKYNSQEDYREK